MLKYYGFLTLLLVTMCLTVSLATANDQLTLKHEVIDAEKNGSYQTVSFMLTINNFSDKNLYRVKLSLSSSEFSSFNHKKIINVGHLPSMGQVVIDWSVRTPIDVSYFQSDMPIFYIIHAKQNNGENIEIPVYSSGSTAL